MGFARCGVEGNLREILESTRKKPFRFYFFVNLKKRKWFLLEGGSPLEISVAVARPSQILFPLGTTPKHNSTTNTTKQNANTLQNKKSCKPTRKPMLLQHI